ncbi:MAG: sigma-54 dependent transcriptional regulator [Deltaproteobacteria bacterium]|nr:sigma-54 dependent transcriptional regulator [Deltaproteobacteria bacterium]
MQQIFRLVKRVAQSDSTVIINGESGSGKGLIARAIHRNSQRKDKPFITINCGAIPENLLESELFGHVKGAFTGATTSKTGKFELAKGGTVFLDEIGDMSPSLQVKILRVLEEKEFEQVGGVKTMSAEVRILAATHRDLETLVSEKTFREDLYYRLNVIPVKVPSLRERKSDIPLLVSHFLAEFNEKNAGAVQEISTEAMHTLKQHSWPGNVRELKNMVERFVVLKGEGVIDPQDLPAGIAMSSPNAAPLPSIEISEEGINLNTAVTEFEKKLILESLNRTNWIKNKAAKLLKLNRTTLVEKIKRYELQQIAV